MPDGVWREQQLFEKSEREREHRMPESRQETREARERVQSLMRNEHISWQGTAARLAEIVDTQADTLDRLAARVDTLTEALRYYADERNYKSQPTPDADRGHYPTYVPLNRDMGKKARSALVPPSGEDT